MEGLLQLLRGRKVGSKGNGKQKENERKAHDMKNTVAFILVRLECDSVFCQFLKITVISGYVVIFICISSVTIRYYSHSIGLFKIATNIVQRTCHAHVRLITSYFDTNVGFAFSIKR